MPGSLGERTVRAEPWGPSPFPEQEGEERPDKKRELSAERRAGEARPRRPEGFGEEGVFVSTKCG